MCSLFSPHLDKIAGYVPGEQPRGGTFVKLNTNENPYPPSPRVAEAIREGLDGRLRLYPDPLGTAFREAVGRRHGVDPDWVLVGNGSDDILTILTRSFAAPGEVIVYPSPSYILYRTLAELQNALPAEVRFRADWTLDADEFARSRPRLAFLANPNSPSGTALPPQAVAEIARKLSCPLVVDEAYADFAASDCVALVETHPNVIISRTLSKGSSLAGLRVGYAIARPEIISGLRKMKDSYNCDALSLLGASAALDDRDYRESCRDRIVATRGRLVAAMRDLGYRVPESQANFVWCEGGPPAATIYEALKTRKILVRLMRYSGIADGLRITVGTDPEIDLLMAAMREIFAQFG